MNRRYLLLLFVLVSSFSWWDTSWEYRRKITLQQNATDFVTYVFLDTKSLIENNKTMPDCSDIVVVKNDATIADYYVADCNSTSTIILFYVTSTLDTFYIYYGNPGSPSYATTSFFVFFDNFDSYAVNSSGSPQWSVESGDFYVGYYKGNKVYRVNSTGESISVAYAGNYSLLTLLNLESGSNLGLVWNYTSNGFISSYLGSDGKVYVCNTTCSSYATYTKKSRNSIIMDAGKLIVNGEEKLRVQTGAGFNGVYANSPTVSGFFEIFAIFKGRGIKGTAGSEESRPPVTVEFSGVSKSNMKTIVYVGNEGEKTVKIELEPKEKCVNVRSSGDGYVFETDFFTVSFNSSGYTVNGSYRYLGTKKVGYLDGCERITLEFVKTFQNGIYWHLVQFYDKSPVIKHIIFVSSNGTLEFNASLKASEGCSGALSTRGYTSSCHSHSPGGEFRTSNSHFCNIHWYSDSAGFYEPVKVSATHFKYVFWENWNTTMGCKPFLRKIELICGVDYFNCSSTTYSPTSILFYVPQRDYELGRIEYNSTGSPTVLLNNKEAGSELIDTSYLIQGLNYLLITGNAYVERVSIYLSHIYNAELFFQEKPRVYEWVIEGPVTGASTRICGIPVKNRIFPFSCYIGTSAELNLGPGEHRIYLLKTRRNYAGVTSKPYPEAGKLRRIWSYLPMAKAKEIPPPAVPPTHERYTATRFFYRNSTIAEVMVTVWKAI